MGKRILLMLTAFLFLTVFLVFQVLVPQSHANEYVIHVDASAHQKFGLYYPATYKFVIPPGAAGLIAQYKFSPDAAWETLAEKSSSDTFNGIDAVRFDYAGGWAYISVGLSRSSDQIYLQILDQAGNPINFTFNSIPKYYDGRKAAVTMTLDDWMATTEQIFSVASDYLTSYGIYFSVGIITGRADWPSFQHTINKNPDTLEVSTHGQSHACNATAYAKLGYDAETAGSKEAIRNNLVFKAHPYIPVYLEPCGYSDASLVSSVTAGGFLLTRKAGTYGGSSFVAWASGQQRYGRSAIVFDDSEHPWDSTQLTQTNSLFDQAASSGGIYHLMNHPEKGFWYDGSYLLQHLQYIKGRNDIWYAALGQLYLYHFLQERRGNLTVTSIEPPRANFSASPLTGTAPLSVNFTDSSTGSITSWLWDFGDSTTSAERNPNHIYGAPGSYTVKLTVSGPDGHDEKVSSGYITVNGVEPVAAFSATPRTGSAPLTVTFTDTSSGSITSRVWDFGDSTTSTDPNPVHTYNNPGSYSVKLAVTGPGGSNEKVEPDYIVANQAAPVAAFSATPRTGSAPLTVSFTDTSTGAITSRVWDFGDSSTSANTNPVHTYNSAGSYAVRLTVTGPGGSNEKVEPTFIVVNEAAPVAGFSATPRTGTPPLTVSFTDTSTGAITGRVWDFGDSSTSTETNPVHTYNSAGSYAVRLSVTGPGGSNVKTEPAYIAVNHPLPAADFSATPRTGVAPLTVNFTDLSTGSITGWLWDFGDSSTSTDRNPVHVYNSNGSYAVNLTVTGPGGNSERNQPAFVVVSEARPVAMFSATPRTGVAPLTVNFTDLSTGSVTGWLWDFGDSSTSTERNPIHVYNSTGSYAVKLSVTGPGGTSERSQPAFVVVSDAKSVAKFSATPRTGVAPLTVNFTDLSTGPITGWLWDFGDSSTSTERNPVHVYSSTGSYAVKLSVTGPGGNSERSQPAFVVVSEAKPVAKFSATPRTGVAPLTVNFTDLSTGSVTGWLWDFGDSSTSTDRNPVHVYNSTGSYAVKLSVTGPGGTTERSQPAFVVVNEAKPVAKFSATPRTGVAPLTVNFTDLSTGSITGWLWDFGDSSTSTDRNPVHVYNSTGSYAVKLSVTGPGGTTERSQPAFVVVNEAKPVAMFSATPRTGVAALTVNFTDLSTGSITGWLWDFGDSSTSTEKNPTHIYNSAGSYTVKLTVTGPAGSNERVETAYIMANEAAPVASFTATPRSGTAPLTVSFTDTSFGSITSRLWDFGDSTTSTVANPTHVYNSPGSYPVKLTVIGPGGSNDRIESDFIDVVEGVVAGFSATVETGTAPYTVNFTDSSSGEINSWLWDFGDSTTSTEMNPHHVYESAGSYTVTLTVRGTGQDERAVRSMLMCFYDVASAQKVKREGM